MHTKTCDMTLSGNYLKLVNICVLMSLEINWNNGNFDSFSETLKAHVKSYVQHVFITRLLLNPVCCFKTFLEKSFSLTI